MKKAQRVQSKLSGNEEARAIQEMESRRKAGVVQLVSLGILSPDLREAFDWLPWN